MEPSNQPTVEIHLFVDGKTSAAAHVFRAVLGGWHRDRLEVQEILDDFDLRSLRAFDPAGSGEGEPVRFSSRDGRSFRRYCDGDVLFLVGQSKEVPCVVSMVPTVVVVGLVAVVKGPELIERWKMGNGKISLPPWLIACFVIVFTVIKNRNG